MDEHPLDDFKPTHRLHLGHGSYWQVQAYVMAEGKTDGKKYYQCITHPRNRSGIHLVSMVPEEKLKPLRTKR